ncbi:class I SAM-dependent methyltransferase [Stappia sp. TSB10P1A]|uniref:class I SAM-dependent methyltransferase n=1 Tax=Stappia sp. TSB10P1A TaxID=2003585 RepID=UPI001643F3C8|nr:methyltransferase domain-containing protein [Stappia sp. TSB10P1A]
MSTNPVDLMTEHLLDEAGIAPGWTVVDIGCGPGAVTRMIARRVGPQGRVLAVDHDPAMLEMTRRMAAAEGLANVSVIEGGFDAELPGHGTLDAVVGRRVLMYQQDPVAAVEAISSALRPGGVVAFHEHDASKLVPGRHPLPLHDEVRDWLAQMLRREGARLDMGLTLHEVMSAAGLTVESLRAEANLLTPDSSYPVGMIVRAVMPRLERFGITDMASADPDTLDARLRQERQASGATCLWELVFRAVARKL